MRAHSAGGIAGGAGLHRVGENAASLTQSSNVVDPRQARMRMGACRRWIALSPPSWERRKVWRGPAFSQQDETEFRDRIGGWV